MRESGTKRQERKAGRTDGERAGEGFRAIHAKAAQLVRLSLEMTAAAGSGHPTSAASLAHVVTALMYRHMRWDPREPDHPAADRLVLSEGHACPIVYAACADLGVAIGREGERRPMTRDDALSLRAIDSIVDGHPNPALGFPFFPAATGSLGQGLSVAAGIALAARLDGLSKRVFCLIGDGESREGQIWEALDFLVDHRLNAVCPIFNANGHGQTGVVSEQQWATTLEKKLAAFGVQPLVLDGHEPYEILNALEAHEAASAGDGKPVALVVRTIKGWGSPSLASQPSGSHGKPAEGDELEQALRELEEERGRHAGDGDGGGELEIRPIPADEAHRSAAQRAGASLPTMTEVLEGSGDARALREGGELATRKAFGLALRALGRARQDVVVLDGDVSNSTYAETFAKDEACRERFFECRIAEQNMASVAAGLASAGKLPFASSFGKFLTRAYDQIEMALVSGHPLRLVGSHVGVSLAADGPSQMALPDVAWFAALGRVRRDGRPLVWTLTPSDARSTYALVVGTAAVRESIYLRTLRPATPLLYGDDEHFELGGHKVLREGSDVAICASGYMVHEALRAAERLAADGIEATVVDLYSLPFDEEPVVELVRRGGGRALSLEDNYGGALGSALAEALAGSLPDAKLRSMFVRDVPKSGRTPDDVLADLGLSSDEVVDAARSLCRG